MVFENRLRDVEPISALDFRLSRIVIKLTKQVIRYGYINIFVYY